MPAVVSRRPRGQYPGPGNAVHHARCSDIDLSRSLRQRMPPAYWGGGRPAHVERRHDRGRRQAGQDCPGRPGISCARIAGRLPRLPHGQPLLRNRSPQPDRVGHFRRYRSGLGPGAGDLRLRPYHIRFDYMQARSTRTAFETFHERAGVCRDFAHLALASALQLMPLVCR